MRHERRALETVEELGGRENFDAALPQPSPELGIVEQIGVASDDRVGPSRDRGRDDRRVVWVTDVHVDVDRRKCPRERPQEVQGIGRSQQVRRQAGP
jgi:hypothetical protein